MYKIATWNINSIRVRLPHILQWLAQLKPDILALQELKVSNEEFPWQDFQALGYHSIYSGQKTYNGVAILSLQPATDVIKSIPSLAADPQQRMIGATINQIRILNLYVPNGESIESVKYQYKLDWLMRMTQFIQEELTRHSQFIVLGDFNIAPEERDVYDASHWEGKVLFSDKEREAFEALLKLGFKDSFRLFNQDKQFSWWDYRMAAFRRNLGVRIDHILASESMAMRCVECLIDKSPRGWERPSDHAPVIAEFV